MRAKLIMLTGFVLVALSYRVSAETGQADIKATTDTSKVSGMVKFEDTKDGLKVTAQIENVPPGKHGFHIHDFGSCGDNGAKAGGHYNPKGAPHGHVTTDGLARAHPGDLGNIEVGPNGKGTLEAVIPGVSLSKGELTVGGRAVVLHEKVDDFGQPTGNAGSRIGCGTIVITGK
jgi:Cu-Zn family superoxide dismutase